jgi:hypothetical protein
MNIFNEFKYRQSGDFGGLVKKPRKWVEIVEALLGGVILVVGVYATMVLISCL